MTIGNCKDNRHKQAGYSLLEVMIAVAILAISLTAVMGLQSQAVIASARAQTMSIVSILARHQMSYLILESEKEQLSGELPNEKSASGDFSEIGFPDFKWEMSLRRVDVPAPPLPEEVGGELMAKIITNISEQISEATRELRLSILWKELDEDESVEFVTHLVSMRTQGGGKSTGGSS